MRLFVVNGSPRSNGSTAKLCKAVAKGSEESGATVIYLCLGEKNLSYCTGCRSCSQSGQCSQTDDMAELLNELVACDALVMASPSYWRDVTAQMKTFIDRCTPLCEYANGNAMATGKRGYSIAVRAGMDKAENLRIVNTFEHFFSHLNINPCGMLTFEGISTEGDLICAHIQQAYEFGKEIGRDGLIKVHAMPK